MIWKPGHYKVVAGVLADHLRVQRSIDTGEEYDRGSKNTLESLANRFANTFAANKRFRKDKFLEAVGVQAREGT